MSLREPQRHDDLLNFRIKRLLLLGGAPAIRICEGQFGLPRQEWRILAALVEAGPNSPMQLAGIVDMERARTSRTLASLVGKGLAQRSNDQADGRRATVRATADGQRLYARLFPLLAQVNVDLVAALDDRELDVLESCIARLTARAAGILNALPADTPKADRRRGGSRRVWSEQASARARVASAVLSRKRDG